MSLVDIDTFCPGLLPDDVIHNSRARPTGPARTWSVSSRGPRADPV